MTRQRIMVRYAVIVLLGVHGADNRQLVHVPGNLRQQFRHLDSGDVGGDRLEVAVRLWIPGIDVAGASVQPEQNARLGLAGLPLFTRRRHYLAVPEILPKGQTQKTERTNVKDGAARKRAGAGKQA